jgi:hypothetical protein
MNTFFPCHITQNNWTCWQFKVPVKAIQIVVFVNSNPDGGKLPSFSGLLTAPNT